MSTPRVGFVSLGCPKALVDTERIVTQLKMDGYDIVDNYKDAGVVVVNTCGFIDEARAESLQAIGEALKENGRVIVTGCLGANAGEIENHHPLVLSVTGPHAYEDVVGAVHDHLPIKAAHDPHTDLVPPQGIKLTPRHYAYLKISEGCNHHCSFCIIPSMRGRLVSRPAGEVLDEAVRLVDAGVKELLVISQDTSAYGVDLKYRTSFWQGRPVRTRMRDLCEALGELGVWTRLHYVYPYPHVDDIVPMMAEGKVLPYLDIPFQHGSPKILKLMRRPGTIDDTLERIHNWRRICPDLTIRSTFIVGFPGETNDDFEQLMSFLTAARLDRVGCFEYSPVEGAAANNLPNPLPPDIKTERFARLMELQARISTARLREKIGRTLDILVDEVDTEGAIGRCSADAPEIDGVVYLNGEMRCRPGDLVRAKVFQSDEHDLWAERV